MRLKQTIMQLDPQVIHILGLILQALGFLTLIIRFVLDSQHHEEPPK